MWNCKNVQRTVKDLYDWQQTHGIPGRERYLLSDFSSSVDSANDFWENYRENHLEYDWYFARRYKNYRYYGQDVEGENPVEDVYFDFNDEVRIFLMVNDKKYSELYKIELDQNVPSPTSDYNINYHNTKTIEREYTSGERTDIGTNTVGATSNTSTNSTKAYNSTEFVEVGKTVSNGQEHTDTSSINKGEQVDNENSTYTDTRTESGSKGSPSENLEKYKEVWSGFSFYSMIFEDICKELLLV